MQCLEAQNKQVTEAKVTDRCIYVSRILLNQHKIYKSKTFKISWKSRWFYTFFILCFFAWYLKNGNDSGRRHYKGIGMFYIFFNRYKREEEPT